MEHYIVKTKEPKKCGINKQRKNMTQVQKVLICGISGFMGMNIAESFLDSDEFDIYGVAKKGERKPSKIKAGNYYIYDLTDGDNVSGLIKGISPDIIIQAAATTSGVKAVSYTHLRAHET